MKQIWCIKGVYGNTGVTKPLQIKDFLKENKRK